MNSKQEPGRLLVVDDNKVNRLLLARGLEAQGHMVETVENGKQALEKLRADSFDLVLLDIEMPEMNGYQVLETCLQDAELRDIPIIMTSSLDELDSVVKCIELGAEDYLNKPVNPILLRARVNASLEKKRLRDEQRKLFRTFATKEVADELLKTGFSLRAAIEMVELLKGFNAQQAAQNKVQIKIGIGIASGRVIAGYTGTQYRATYTCVGDTVNIAARIQGHTKVVDRPVLIDQYTRERLPADIKVEALGPILFKGKQQPIHIFAVVPG
jgi:CheY-like chemotaxis protein